MNLSIYADKDFGLLLPTAVTMALMDINEYTLRKYRPLLQENLDFLRRKGQDHIERIFYTSSGIVKLAESLATPKALQVKETVQNNFSPSGHKGALVPAERGAMMTPFSPAATLSQESDWQPAYTFQDPLVNSRTSPVSYEPPGGVSYEPLASMMNQFGDRLGAELGGLAQRVESALTRLEQRPQELITAEDLFAQQKISAEQFMQIVDVVLRAQGSVVGLQQAGVQHAHHLITSATSVVPSERVIVQEHSTTTTSSQGLGDIVAILNSPGFSWIVGMGALVISAIILFGLLSGDSTVYQPQQYAPQPQSQYAPVPQQQQP